MQILPLWRSGNASHLYHWQKFTSVSCLICEDHRFNSCRRHFVVLIFGSYLLAIINGYFIFPFYFSQACVARKNGVLASKLLRPEGPISPGYGMECES